MRLSLEEAVAAAPSRDWGLGGGEASAHLPARREERAQVGGATPGVLAQQMFWVNELERLKMAAPGV